jgi:hypothetical protein
LKLLPLKKLLRLLKLLLLPLKKLLRLLKLHRLKLHRLKLPSKLLQQSQESRRKPAFLLALDNRVGFSFCWPSV